MVGGMGAVPYPPESFGMKMKEKAPPEEGADMLDAGPECQNRHSGL